MGENEKSDNSETKNTLKSDNQKQSRKFSFVERIINKGPLPNAESSISSRILNMIFYSSLLPAIAFIYFHLSSISPLRFSEGSRTIPLEALLLWIVAFLFAYTFILYHASGRLRQFFSGIRPCLDYTADCFSDFEEKTLTKTFRPPLSLLLLLLTTIPMLLIGLVSTPMYAGDNFTTLLVGLALFYSTLLHWNASWMLYSFLATSNRFGRDVPIRINPFDPDKVGGLASLSDLSTLAIFDVGLISILIIPLWQVFFPPASFAMIGLTSLLIPVYFLISMRGIYSKLSMEKEKSLDELNDEIQKLSERIRRFICEDHCNEQKEEKEITKLGQALNSMDIIYGRVRAMHTFPVNVEIMVKIFVSAILPILAVILDFVLTRFL